MNKYVCAFHVSTCQLSHFCVPCATVPIQLSQTSSVLACISNFAMAKRAITEEDRGFFRDVKKFKVDTDLPEGSAQWYWEDDKKGFTPCTVWEIALFEEAAKNGRDFVVYEWPSVNQYKNITETEYEVDLKQMTQTNRMTNKVRKLIRLQDNHTILAPTIADEKSLP